MPLTTFDAAEHPRAKSGQFAAYKHRLKSARQNGEAIVYHGADFPRSDAVPRPNIDLQQKLARYGLRIRAKTPGALFVSRDARVARHYGDFLHRFALSSDAQMIPLNDPRVKLAVGRQSKGAFRAKGHSDAPAGGFDKWNRPITEITARRSKVLVNQGIHGVEAPQIVRHDSYAIVDPSKLRLLGVGVKKERHMFSKWPKRSGGRHFDPMSKFDATDHPRSHDGRFLSARGRQAIIRALPAVRGHSGPSMGAPALREASPGPAADDRRSNTRGESWQRIGSKIAAIPVEYTGKKDRERPVGSFLHLTLDNQIPKSMSVEDHLGRSKRFVQMAKDQRENIIEGATKTRKGKRHVYLKAYEPASGGVARSRMKPDKFPEDTPRATLNRAYNHAVLLSMHDRGLVNYDFKMDDALQDELRPTIPFIRYARQRLNQQANVTMPGERQQYLDSHGQSWTDQHGRPRRRFKPNQQLVKRFGGFGSFARRNASRALGAIDQQANPEGSLLHEGGHAFGSFVAREGRQLFRNPIKYAKKSIAEGARFGSGFATGAAGELGVKSPAGVRRAARIGAVTGGGKLAIGGALIAHKPIGWAYRNLTSSGQSQQAAQPGQGKRNG